MVMAGNESLSKQGVDEALTTKLQLLRQRRELLEEKLAQKSNELKNVCIAEAELTGVLPTETPLEPGEKPPSFCHRVTAAISQPNLNLNINKIKNSEAEELELERQIQLGLAETALRIINDPTKDRALRRKQRSLYQQCQRKLQELDARLNFVMQGTSSRHVSTYGGQGKHRTKKPRPPLTGSLRETHVKPLHEHGGVSLSPLGSEQSYGRYPEYVDPSLRYTPPNLGNRVPYLASSPVDRYGSAKYIDEQNINNNVYILPDQFRARTLSQGAVRNTSPRGQARYDERSQRLIPNSFLEDERLYRHSQDIQQSDGMKQYSDYRYLDNEIHQKSSQLQCNDEFYPQRYPQSLDYHGYRNKIPPQLPLPRQKRDQDAISVVDGRAPPAPRQHTVDYTPPGYWVRQNGEIIWYPEDKYIEKFGSLDRRKQNFPEVQSRYHTVTCGPKNSSSNLRQTQVVNLEPPIIPSNRILRTQSLGSVEARQFPDERSEPGETSRKGKEKGWYETSLDTNYAPHPVSNLRPSGSIRSERRYDSHKEHPAAAVRIPEIRRAPEIVDEPPPRIPSRYYEPPRVLEIPAESKEKLQQENGNEITIPLHSPTNHTIVHPGKYQPYREVTKPFEMSDFYKYSTKFRKSKEANQMAAALASLGESPQTESNNPQVQRRKVGQFYDSR